LLAEFPETLASHVLAEAEPMAAIAALLQLEPAARERHLEALTTPVAQELRGLMNYPENSAGRLMNPRVAPLRAEMLVGDAIERLRAMRNRTQRILFVVDAEGRLVGRVDTVDLVLADHQKSVGSLMREVKVRIHDLDPREEVVDILERTPLNVLPVVSHSGRLLGAIDQAELVSAVQQEASLDLQPMVGASADERALSPATFAVRKRLPWLQINLLTAFLAAAVVGSFESLIAKFTALAVLLPVVAGQSGNAGAQALAVTMRGLVLREISLRHWPKVLGKEAFTGLVNGLAIAATTALGVYVWSRSVGLMLIIAIAMVLSMVSAGLAGALVPILLRRFGQDPATASSIILTTVTDVVGFFSFLGIATLMAPMLDAG
jgi:magnesium transporter